MRGCIEGLLKNPLPIVIFIAVEITCLLASFATLMTLGKLDKITPPKARTRLLCCLMG
ncbi:MAG TPA: hypothetical protein VJK54_07525 [Chthoniobacterales bacterium]|nr:hypothetical protein [Chthoniobacterales bacterium]